MSEFLVHFEQQLNGVSLPATVYYMKESPGKLELFSRSIASHEELDLGLSFVRMQNNIPIFTEEQNGN